MSRIEARMSLLGRADGCAVLDGLIEDLRQGEGRSLVLRGEAGIGKTVLRLTLALVARRLLAEPVRVVFAARGPVEALSAAVRSVPRTSSPVTHGRERRPIARPHVHTPTVRRPR